MNIKNEIRKTIFSKMSESQIDCFYKIYYRLRYCDEMQKKISYGDMNPDKIFYLIRPRKDGIEGLLSLFWNVIRNIDYAKEKNYIPVVDFKNYKSQYSMNDYDNVWEYYFTQPSNYSLEEVYKSKNIIISGLETQWYKKELYKANYEQKVLEELHQMIFKHIDFSEEVKKRVSQEISDININLESTVGLYLRGTDYVNLKPSGHPIQPTVDQAIEVVDSYIKKYQPTSLFLVTEDGEIYDEIKAKYGDRCVTPKYEKYIYNYDGKSFLSNDKCIDELADNAYERGMNYLIKMIILSRCAYVIGGNTNGMWAVNVFSKNRFKDHFIFELGLYGK